MNGSAAAGPALAPASAVLAQAAGRWSRLVDHSWLLLDGVLFCVAGSLHTATEVTGCAYWISTPLAEHLQRQLPALCRVKPGPAPLLRYADATYVKLSALAPPQLWPAVHGALTDAGTRPVEASLLATAQLTAAEGMLDPRDALRAAAALPAHLHRCGLETLHALLAAIGDPAGDSGVLGLTGSAAFDPRRLCRSVGDTGIDIDLLIYDQRRPAASARSPLHAEVLIHAGISELRGERLADLPAADPRLAAYGGSRLFPAGRAGPDRDRLWARRRDVAWIGDVRLDLTVVPPAADLVGELPYAAPPERPVAGLAQLDAVAPGYPARLTARLDGQPADIWVTARGFDGALRPGDRIQLAGVARGTGRGPVATVDDVPSHHLQLEA